MKPFWQSKTFWVNILGAAELVFQSSGLDAGTIAAILAVANILLRFITKEPVSMKGGGAAVLMPFLIAASLCTQTVVAQDSPQPPGEEEVPTQWSAEPDWPNMNVFIVQNGVSSVFDGMSFGVSQRSLEWSENPELPDGGEWIAHPIFLGVTGFSLNAYVPTAIVNESFRIGTGVSIEFFDELFSVGGGYMWGDNAGLFLHIDTDFESIANQF